MTYRNPTNGYTERARLTWLWALLFGVFYFAVKGIWRHALIGFVLAFITLGVSWVVYAFAAPGIIHRDYLRRGWQPV